MAKYSKGASDKVERAMHEKKEGTLKSGRSGKKVTSRKQAIAIGLSEARKEGKKGSAKNSQIFTEFHGWGREILPQIYFADEAAGVVLEAAGAAVELAALVELPEFEEEEPSL